MRKTILLIIATFLSITFLIVEYFEIRRYMCLKYSKETNMKLLEKYSTLPKGSDNKTIISVYFDYTRIKELIGLLNSILDQTVKVDQINLIAPLRDISKIPENFKDIFTIIPCDQKDFSCKAEERVSGGSRTDRSGTEFRAKVLQTCLLNEDERDTNIIIISSYDILGKDFVFDLLNFSNNNQDYIIVTDNSVCLKAYMTSCDNNLNISYTFKTKKMS